MATQPANDVPEPLKYQTWVLKVSIHCEGCKKKVKKILHNIDGVFTTSIDSEQDRVVVTGNVEAETLIKKLAKARKHAEVLHEIVSEKEKNSGKSKKKKKKNNNNNKNNNPDNGEKASDDDHKDSEKERENLAKNSDENNSENEKPDRTSNGGKKKKKKGKKENNPEGAANGGDAPASTGSFTTTTSKEVVDPPIGSMNLGPPSEHVYQYPSSSYPPPLLAYGLNYNTTHHGGSSSYYAQPAYGYGYGYGPYGYGYNQSHANYPPPPQPYPFRGFNPPDRDYYGNKDDEGGCSIM